MTHLSRKTRESIRDLAIAYAQYCVTLDGAASESRDLAICCWGDMLLERQTELSVVMFEEGLMREVIARARARRAEREERPAA
jgi:hypothetical protein